MTADPTWSYDRLADVYATDMGASMPFDDVGFYRQLAQRCGGRVLEVGCGTGRILLPLRQAGIDIVGVDRSEPMLLRLRRDAAALGLAADVVCQDLRALTIGCGFALILAPYSIITYLTTPPEVDAFVAAAVGALAPGGRLVLDAFVPREVTSMQEFRLDYRRPHQGGWLEREKRIRVLGDGCNRIQRRYRLLDAQAQIYDEFTTVDCIRPYTPDDLRAIGQRHRLAVEREVWDYSREAPSPAAQFFTLVLRG